MFCTSCGTPRRYATDRFCRQCGTAHVDAPVLQQPVSPQPSGVLPPPAAPAPPPAAAAHAPVAAVPAADAPTEVNSVWAPPVPSTRASDPSTTWASPGSEASPASRFAPAPASVPAPAAPVAVTAPQQATPPVALAKDAPDVVLDDPDATIDRHQLARLRQQAADAPPVAAPAPAPAPTPAAAPIPAASEPGWYPDPWRRAEHRWHDGEGWTSTVASGSTTWVDVQG